MSGTGYTRAMMVTINQSFIFDRCIVSYCFIVYEKMLFANDVNDLKKLSSTNIFLSIWTFYVL